jgi:non-ribosomal peptide synthetase component F
VTRSEVDTVLRVPASPSQRRLWAIEQTTAGEPLHNLNMELLFPGPVDPDVLRAAVADVIARHETLRTRFEVVDGVPHQCVLAPDTPLAVPFTDLTGLPADEAAQRSARERDALAARSFDLATAPLLRIGHVRTADHTAVVVVVHHIVVDAWSCQVVITDLHRAITARAAGRAPDWEPVPVQFADYTAWRASQADSPQALADLAYWRECLADVAVLDLTLGRPYPAEPSYRGGELAVELDERVTAGLDRLAAGERATRFAVLVAAWAAALGRVFGGQDVPIGTSVANRDLPDIARTAGFFVDRLVLRLSLAGAPTFRELVRSARDVVLGAYEHNSVGFDQIVDAVAPPRRFGVAPLAQASINLQPRMGSVTPGPRTELGGGQFGNGTSRHDIGLDLADFGRTISGGCQYRYDVVPAAAARRAHQVFLDVLVRCATDPAAADLPAGELTALSPDEVARLHADQDGGPLARQPASLRSMVDEWVRTTPTAVAVSAADRDLSYAQLTDLADRLATRLAAAGVRPGDTVLVGLPRRAALPVALLGVQAAGAAPVALDLSAPPDHLATVAATAGARTAVVPPGTTFPADVTTVPLNIDELAAVDRAEPVAGPVAYVLFTSGTTGRPKGVVVEQRQLVAYTTGVLGLLEPPPGALHLLVQAPTFDSSWTTVAGALASGGVLRLVDEDVARDPAELAARLAGSPVDYLKITPSHLAALLTGVPAETLRPRRALVLGGESERMTAVDRLRGLGWRVFGHYGPTETTIGVLAHELPATTGSATVPLGRPLPGVRVYVLDDDLRPVPPGCRGEL